MTAVFALILFCLSGCEQQTGQTAPQPVKPAYQRFVPIHREPATLTGVPWSGAFALDTKTGQLCQTYVSSNAEWDAVPLCFDLYKRFPD